LNHGRRFTRTVENFKCLNCGLFVRGNGYTNHCPNCLWSRHVDEMPGDRGAECRGAMVPVGVEVRSAGIRIIHECVKCGLRRTTKSVKADSYDAILRLSSAPFQSRGNGDV
jgi:hypothetical protein